MPSEAELTELLDAVPVGYRTGRFRGRAWGVTKRVHNRGRSFEIFAECLGGGDFVSLNAYFTRNGVLLRPCEMAEKKVVGFLREVRFAPGEGIDRESGLRRMKATKPGEKS